MRPSVCPQSPAILAIIALALASLPSCMGQDSGGPARAGEGGASFPMDVGPNQPSPYRPLDVGGPLRRPGLEDGVTGAEDDARRLSLAKDGSGTTAEDGTVYLSDRGGAPGAFGEPCGGNEDCESGFCVDGNEGSVCTDTCLTDCPEGWRCRGVMNIVPDLVFVCVPDTSTLCLPCRDDRQCRGGLCFDIGASQRCTVVCSDALPCPAGFECAQVHDRVRAQMASVCVPRSGACDCLGQDAGAQRTCIRENDVGRCMGVETCDPEQGWIGCDATEPGDERCNGLDDDCDGRVDEDLAQGQECITNNEHGTCRGQAVCLGPRGWMCSAAEPEPEICDFRDNDCDSETDEDFKVDGDYALHGHCGACGVDCANAIEHAAATYCDASGGAPVCRVNECEPGYFRANDLFCQLTGDVHCRPCESDADCSGGICRPLGGRQHCTSACDADADCPEGHRCLALGSPSDTACVPQNGTCDCGPGNAGSRRMCTRSNAHGTCMGLEVCDAQLGWVGCDAVDAAPEDCNGVDDDCNGLIDDGLPATKPCHVSNEDGACFGEATCCGTAGWFCSALQPLPETCNYRDDDCNGQIDDGFADPAGRYTSKEHCGRCDTSCDAALPNAALTACDASAEPPRCMVVACKPGFLKVDDLQCIPVAAGLCEPCLVDENCSLPGARCLELQDGRACGSPCGSDAECPDGYLCMLHAGSGQCTPKTSSCTCDGNNTELARSCSQSYQPPGGGATVICEGVDRCGPNGWTGCRLPDEVCNGVDDDCDGRIDEGFRNASGAYDQPAHCGECNNNCSALQAPNAVPHCAAQAGAAPYCTFACNQGTFDVNENPSDGCECVFSDATDVPADGADTNCDGVDGTIERSVFVAKNGNDSGPGTLEQPRRTITAGIQRASETGRPWVLVATGVYSESIALIAGVSIYGGYSSDFRNQSALLYETVISGEAPTPALPAAVNGLRLRGGAETAVVGFTIFGHSNRTPGGTSVAVRLHDCDDSVELRDNRIVAGDGGKGLRGQDGVAGVAGNAGQPGTASLDTRQRTCQEGSTLAGGVGAVGRCEHADVSGGKGGDSRCPRLSPPDRDARENGSDGAGAQGQHGAGGEKGYDAEMTRADCLCHSPSGIGLSMDARAGTDGADGNQGVSGTGAAHGAGWVGQDGRWQGLVGAAGGLGGHGGGGGGGGAGGGVNVESQCQLGGDDLGGSGGGGGSGGCGGSGGTGGTAGGGSVGVALSWTTPPISAPIVEGNRIETGFGGDGGDGGTGGTGGIGGDGREGGLGGKPNSDWWCAQPGARGGQGGDGGHGGGGGGGAGGISFGIVAHGNGALSLQSLKPPFNTVTLTGARGGGGTGGASLGLPGSPGADGASGATNIP